jgi:pimeloyl-ACP methyl ester carboxylesterase
VGLVCALDALLDRPALLYGNSMGGIAAVRYAQRRPERVAGLLLNSPGGSPDSDDELAAFLAQFRLSDAAGGRRFFDLLHRRPTWLGWIVGPWIRRKLAQPTIQRLLDGVTQGDLLRPDEVGALRGPIRLLWGVADGLMPRRHFARWHSMLPPQAEVSTPDIGHCPYLDTPWVLVREIRGFAARHASQG